ncbi:MAG: hypothetical protein HZC48_00115 [Nitrospirae bacterium]|nr:hypothetical protein [Nitrospirota bacterium]
MKIVAIKRKLFRMFILLIVSLVSHIFLQANAVALDKETHYLLNQKIVVGTNLDNYLKVNLGVTNGIKEEFDVKTVLEWVKEGGKKEDEPIYLRSVNHFHDPLATSLSDAGFSGFWFTDFLSGSSSIQWSQYPLGAQTMQVLGSGNYSWYDVRDYYYKALTSVNNLDRGNNYAETFRWLGQLMHLVEDMSVPEHARDDGHYADERSEII